MYKIEVNDGCPWGRDEGYPTLDEAKKDLKEIIAEDKKICGGSVGMVYSIVQYEEVNDVIYYNEVLEVKT